MPEMLVVDFERCTGCRLCEIACSLAQDGVCNPAAARLTVVGWEAEGIDVPVVCQQCEAAACARVCPAGAITQNATTGAWIVNHERCIGCRMCIVACPYGAISVHPTSGKIVKCNLCDGQPNCVRFCETQAIRFVAPARVAADKQQAAAERLAMAVKGQAIVGGDRGARADGGEAAGAAGAGAIPAAGGTQQ